MNRRIRLMFLVLLVVPAAAGAATQGSSGAGETVDRAAREAAWTEEYNAGLAALQREQVALAVIHFERAQAVDDRRPEALVNLGALYTQSGQPDKAIAIYERSLAIINGPWPVGIDRSLSARWKAYEPVTRFNLATLHASRGIDFFQAQNLDEAIASFRTSLQWNPHSRDIRYNLSQALYILASQGKERGTPAAELAALHQEIIAEASKVREADPGNVNLLRVLGYTYRNLGDEGRAAAVLAEGAAFPFEIHDVRMEVGTVNTRLSGVLRNLTLAEGDPVRLRLTLLALNGTAMGSSEVQLTAPPANQGAGFGVRITTSDDVAGWKYEVLGGK